MSSSFFYEQVDKNDQNSEFLSALESFSTKENKQVYVVTRPLGDSRYTYDFNQGLVLLIPNYKLIFINYGTDDEEFEEYVDDFIEDLGAISDKFRYKDIIGRPRAWKKLIEKVVLDDVQDDIDRFLEGVRLTDGQEKKKCELLISLITGSVNDIEKVKADVPNNILDKVKQKILLFDGDQTRFVYQKHAKKRINIQGLSGTGKTELLLHKLKEMYVESKDSKIVLTCHNKILANNLKNRIPDFFNFMKVEEQIKWNERLWCINAWGSQNDENSGVYTHVCHKYKLQFRRWSTYVSFDSVCQAALDELKEVNIEDIGYAFDYMLVDESQDFPQSFFELCEKVTKQTVYVAGDVFQGIFDSKIISEITPDYLLSKCYRTDPRTLMFAHAVGMGLFETPKLRWLEDDEWSTCGYLYKKNEISHQYTLSREPLRRFEDLDSDNLSSIDLITTTHNTGESSESKIIQILRDIKEENPTVLADDIGVIIMGNIKASYLLADKLEFSIHGEFGWAVNKAYESKRKRKDTLFVSNQNHVKGLEFPFVICVTERINNQGNYRNALYMTLTRSFLKTYLLLSQENNPELFKQLESGLAMINSTGSMTIGEPSDPEKEAIRTTINYNSENVSFYDFIHNIFDDMGIMPLFRTVLFEIVTKMAENNFDEEEVREIISFSYEKMLKADDS
ncbi:MAG: AAA family ATPase [Gammaproteobacteria bacterium]|nr:AAA family ATPase [Gammaproteobacteria bacterium]